MLAQKIEGELSNVTVLDENNETTTATNNLAKFSVPIPTALLS